MTHIHPVVTLVGNFDEEIKKGMISVEAWTTIRYLHAQGSGIREIARELSISRNTVRSALRQEEQPRYQRKKRPEEELDGYEKEIRRMYLEQGFIGSRILRELNKLGYRGKKSTLYERLRALKAERADGRLTERFETSPGQQGQFDWSPYTVMLGGATVRVVVYCLTLAYSRRKIYWPSLDETQVSIFEAVEACLRHFGGSPKELLPDYVAGNIIQEAFGGDAAQVLEGPTVTLQEGFHFSVGEAQAKGTPLARIRRQKRWATVETPSISTTAWPQSS